MAGVYAIKVSGQLPDEMRSTLEEEYRIQYIPYVLQPRGKCTVNVYANVVVDVMVPRRRPMHRRFGARFNTVYNWAIGVRRIKDTETKVYSHDVRGIYAGESVI